jgi:hypothetical protein
MKRSILQELGTYIPHRTKTQVIESRASHVIQSATNLLDELKQLCPEDYELLEKRLLSSIRDRDPEKFMRVVRKIG